MESKLELIQLINFILIGATVIGVIIWIYWVIKTRRSYQRRISQDIGGADNRSGKINLVSIKAMSILSQGLIAVGIGVTAFNSAILLIILDVIDYAPVLLAASLGYIFTIIGTIVAIRATMTFVRLATEMPAHTKNAENKNG